MVNDALRFKHDRFPPTIIRYSIWLYFRFTLSLRDDEELFAERGLNVSYEAVRQRLQTPASGIAANLRERRPAPSNPWKLDEMAVMIRGKG